MYGWTVHPDRPDIDHLTRDGFRFKAVSPAKPPGVRRLVFLGDSFTLGAAFPYAATYPALLGRWLADSGESWQILSFSASGWGTAQQLLALRHDALAYEPDLVVLQVLPLNDLCNNSLPLAFACDLQDYHRPYFVIDEQNPRRLRSTWLHPTRSALRRSALYRLMERKGWFGLGPPRGPSLQDPSAYRHWLRSTHRKHSYAAGLEMKPTYYTYLPPEETPAAIRQSWEITDRLFEEIAQELEARSIPSFALVVPDPESLDEKRMASFRRPDVWPRHPQGAPNLRPENATRPMEESLRRHGFKVLSLSSQWQSQSLLPRDAHYPFGKPQDRHFNRMGHFLTARWLLDLLHEEGWTEAVPPSPALEAAGTVDLITDASYPVSVRGLRGTQGHPPRREARGRRSSLTFLSDQARRWRLTYEMRLIEPQRAIEVWVNDKLRSKTVLEGDAHQTQIDLWGRPGRNEIRIQFRPGVKNGVAVATFDQLRLEPLAAPTAGESDATATIAETTTTEESHHARHE